MLKRAPILRNGLLLCALLVSPALVAAACSTSTPVSTTTATTSPSSPTTAAAIDAGAVFAAKCAACHGTNRQGTPGLAPALTAATLAGKSDAALVSVITDGRTGTAMPSFKGQLTSGEIDALVKFIKS